MKKTLYLRDLLPFISYGGSSVLFLLVEMGLVLSVGKGIKLKDL